MALNSHFTSTTFNISNFACAVNRKNYLLSSAKNIE